MYSHRHDVAWVCVENPKAKASGEWAVKWSEFITQEKTLTYLAVCHCVLNTSKFLENHVFVGQTTPYPYVVSTFLRLRHEEAIDCHCHTWLTLIGCTLPTFVTLNAASSSPSTCENEDWRASGGGLKMYLPPSLYRLADTLLIAFLGTHFSFWRTQQKWEDLSCGIINVIGLE